MNQTENPNDLIAYIAQLEQEESEALARLEEHQKLIDAVKLVRDHICEIEAMCESGKEATAVLS